jgi:flagellar biosynthesis/type III secretory pathway M-ring protein FliF/YscJ
MEDNMIIYIFALSSIIVGLLVIIIILNILRAKRREEMEENLAIILKHEANKIIEKEESQETN